MPRIPVSTKCRQQTAEWVQNADWESEEFLRLVYNNMSSYSLPSVTQSLFHDQPSRLFALLWKISGPFLDENRSYYNKQFASIRVLLFSLTVVVLLIDCIEFMQFGFRFQILLFTTFFQNGKNKFLSSLKLLWNPSLRIKFQQWKLEVLFPCDEERRGIVSEMSESVHDKVQVSFLSQHALYLFSLFFLFCLFVCLFIFGDVNILHTINKINRLRLAWLEWNFYSSRTSTQNENLSGLYR